MASYKGYNTAIIPTGPMGISTITSQPLSAEFQEGLAFQPIWTGNPTGTFAIYVSLDYTPNLQNNNAPLNPGTWDNLGATVAVNPAGTPGHCYIPVYASCTAWYRLQYVGTGGAGVLSGRAMAKTRG
jgi:hypothetical protein